MIRIAVCSICCKTKKENLLLFGKNICRDCESKLTQSDVGHLMYDFYIRKIGNILTAAVNQQQSMR